MKEETVNTGFHSRGWPKVNLQEAGISVIESARILKEHLKENNKMKNYAVINNEKIELPDGAKIEFKTPNTSVSITVKTEPELPTEFNFKGGYWINNFGKIEKLIDPETNRCKNDLPTREYTEAMAAFYELISFRHEWLKIAADGWEPDWKDGNQNKFVIEIEEDEILCEWYSFSNTFLSFPTGELRDKFLKEFRPLIEKAKMFL